MTKSISSAIHNLKLEHVWIIYPGKTEYSVGNKTTVVPLTKFSIQEKMTAILKRKKVR